MHYGIHWFRRDLRIAGNPALQANWKASQGKVLGLFCFDKKFLSREDFSHNRFQFFLETLVALEKELKEAGGDLLFMDVGPESAFETLFEKLKLKGKPLPNLVSWNRDYEPFARARDAKMSKWFEAQGVSVATERDHCLIEPHEIFKGEDPTSAYQVYSPFSRKWMEFLKTPGIKARVDIQKKGITHLDQVQKRAKTEPLFSFKWNKLLDAADLGSVLEHYREKNGKNVTISIPAVGTMEALKRVREFKKAIRNYGKDRDIPSLDGTSKLSHFFKNGSLTGAQVIAELDLDRPGKITDGEEKYLKEIIWREFYYHILWHHPRVEKTAFLEKFENLKWENNENHFAAWKQGLTGYPIVDAGMRQLAKTGWMHNRVR
ncbi:MAG: deoxyribodipyrimidine photo-lyase, partial [Pseudomonadota bacterium]